MNNCLSLIKNCVKHIVAVKPLERVCTDESIVFEDARSAAFYAMGIALKKEETVFLLVPGCCLSSAYTAVTEAWFQKANVFVVAFFDKISEVKTSWMDRCVLNTLTVGNDEWELADRFIHENSGKNGPILLNIVDSCGQREETDYTKLIRHLNGRKVITFNGSESSGEVVTNVPYRYKYGLLSKYIGMSSAKDCGILLCTSDAVLVDVSIFRTRYANANMKVAIIDDGSISENGIDRWISENGWNCRVSERCEDIKWLLVQEKQSVLVLKEA